MTFLSALLSTFLPALSIKLPTRSFVDATSVLIFDCCIYSIKKFLFFFLATGTFVCMRDRERKREIEKV
jgi:hypothetical protein